MSLSKVAPEFLVDNLYAFNRRLTALGGQMLRLAERHKIKRIDFLKSSIPTMRL